MLSKLSPATRCGTSATALVISVSRCASGFSALSYDPSTGELDVHIPANVVADALGSWAFAYELGGATVSGNAAYKQIVSKVLNRVVAAGPAAGYPASREIEWNVQVVEDDHADAAAFPGGGILVNTGLLRFTKNDEDLLAVALGHEVSHVLGEHFAARLEKEAEALQQLIELVQSPQWEEQGISPELQAVIFGALAVSHEVLEVTPFVKEHEFAADKMGVTLMAFAGYDPQSAVSFWQNTALSQTTESWSLTHPSDQERLERLEAAVDLLGKTPSSVAKGS